MIEAHDLWKAFGATQAVAGVSFAAHDGQITGLLGPNGAGKTTTLRMLYTLMRPDRGQIRVDGIDAASAPMQVRQRIGALPDARGLYKRLTARENVEYFARLHGMSAAQARERCSELLRALQMQTLADRRAEGFSQGERVKTAIARALVHNPRNVILDEPANGLDVMANRGLREVLRNL
ncbi:MAG TPA: ATP-binding cassette domain-containing protein, partial [Burkholderiaceae bacterium]|nr:ATP-binding cassette domain-containing protein [Burkholderiaceae bacterium]